MDQTSAFEQALYDLYRTFCRTEGLPEAKGMSAFQSDAGLPPGTLTRVLKGGGHWVSLSKLETILNSLYTKQIISAADRALWRKHLHRMRIRTILFHAFQKEVYEDAGIVLPPPLTQLLIHIAEDNCAYETAIAVVETMRQKGSETRGYKRGTRPAPRRYVPDEPWPNWMSIADSVAKKGRESPFRRFAQRFLEWMSPKHEATALRAPGLHEGSPELNPPHERPNSGEALREKGRRWRASRAEKRRAPRTGELAAAPNLPSNLHDVKGRPYPLALDWREVVAWLADRENIEVVAHRDKPERCLLSVYLHARDGIDVGRTGRYSFSIGEHSIRWHDPHSDFWVERPLAAWEDALRHAEETSNLPQRALRACDELDILRRIIGTAAVDHIVGAVCARTGRAWYPEDVGHWGHHIAHPSRSL